MRIRLGRRCDERISELAAVVLEDANDRIVGHAASMDQAALARGRRVRSRSRKETESMNLASWFDSIDNKDVAIYVILGLFVTVVVKSVALMKTAADGVSLISALWPAMAIVLAAIFGEKYLINKNGNGVTK